MPPKSGLAFGRSGAGEEDGTAAAAQRRPLQNANASSKVPPWRSVKAPEPRGSKQEARPAAKRSMKENSCSAVTVSGGKSGAAQSSQAGEQTSQMNAHVMHAAW